MSAVACDRTACVVLGGSADGRFRFTSGALCAAIRSHACGGLVPRCVRNATNLIVRLCVACVSGNCAVVNKNSCCLCLGVVAARTQAVLCKDCAVNKNNCILCKCVCLSLWFVHLFVDSFMLFQATLTSTRWMSVRNQRRCVAATQRRAASTQSALRSSSNQWLDTRARK